MKSKALFTIITIIIIKGEAMLLQAQQFAIMRNCSETYSITVPKYTPYREPYQRRNWLGFTKWDTRTNYRLENHVTYHKRNVCCNGYTTFGPQMCLPICSNCGANAVCTQPETCKCDSGYEMDYYTNKCKPICLNECVNGHCESPDVCACNEGYRMLPDGYTCVPICNSCVTLEYCVEPHICKCLIGYTRKSMIRLDSQEMIECKAVCDVPCTNGDCVEPNLCKCHKGYHSDNEDQLDCLPICDPPCDNGVCVAPNTCTCYPMYAIDTNYNYICHPVCNQTCVNADCIAPNTCSCRNGYVSYDPKSNTVCSPYCSSSCTNGQCLEPEICSCNPGYMEANNRTACEPICNETCVMGTCTGPNTCSCIENYKLAEGSRSFCEPVCEAPCINGRCTAPNECTCDYGYEKKNSTNDNSTCIPICECENGYCNDTSPECEKCAVGYDLTIDTNSTTCKPHCESGCENGQCVEPERCECDEYYLSTNDTDGNSICVHACGGECVHGTCMQDTGKCGCLYGWTGKYCDVPSSCAINLSENQTIYFKLNESLSYDEEDVEDPWTGPRCDEDCLQDVNNMTKCIHRFNNEIKIICFIDLDSQCNVKTIIQYKKYKIPVSYITTAISSTVAVLLSTTALISIVFYIRKRKMKQACELTEPIASPEKREEDCLIENENDGISL